MSTRDRRRLLEDLARTLASEHNGVLSRGQLAELGLTRFDVRREVQARRWTVHGSRTVAVHTGRLDQRARWRVAVLETGAHAALDGVSALQAAGLRNYICDTIHVSVPRGTHPTHLPGVAVHETRRRADGDLVAAGIPRVRPAIAAVRAGLWAASDRQAALLLVMAVQQRLTTAGAVAAALRRVRRDRRRTLLVLVLKDVADGVQALGELDFARLCRSNGIPEPSRQALRVGPHGRVYLDVYWDDCDLVAEIEGVHHGDGQTQVDDALRQNAFAVTGTRWLRLPLLGLRIAPTEFMGQVSEARQARLAA